MILLLGIAILVGIPLLCVALAYGVIGTILMGIVGYHKMVFEGSVDEWNKASTRPMKVRIVLLGIFLHILPYAYVLTFLYGITAKSTICVVITVTPLVLAGIGGFFSNPKLP